MNLDNTLLANHMMPEKPLLRALAGETCRRPPIWLMRQAGRYLPEYRETRGQAESFLDLCFTPELAIEVTLQPIRRYGFDGAIVFSDILVVPYALGQKVWFEDGIGPRLHALAGPSDLERLSVESVTERLAPVFEALGGLARVLPPETALIGFAGAPWTVASYMVEGGSTKDFALAKSWAYGDPASFQTLIDILIDATSRYLSAQVEAGAEVLQIFDSWAGVLPEGALRRWCLAPLKEIVRRVKEAHPKIPVIVFPRGAGLLYKDFAEQCGADALSLDTSVPLGWARDHLRTGTVLQGNLDPVLAVVGGAPMREAAREILGALAEGPFVFNLGHGILPTTPPHHVAELVELVRDWEA